jgi:hypothetical protein
VLDSNITFEGHIEKEDKYAEGFEDDCRVVKESLTPYLNHILALS